MPKVETSSLLPEREADIAGKEYCLAMEAIEDGDIVYVSGFSGGIAEVSLADATDPAKSRGKLLVALYRLAAGQRGNFARWRILDADTTGLAQGDTLYLSADLPGSYVDDPEVTAVVSRPVGEVVIASADGKVLLAPGENSIASAEIGTGVESSPVLVEVPVAALAPTTLIVTQSLRLVDAWLVITTGGAGPENWVISEGVNTITTQAVAAVAANDIVRATNLNPAFADIVPPETVTVNLDGGTYAGTAYLLFLPI